MWQQTNNPIHPRQDNRNTKENPRSPHRCVTNVVPSIGVKKVKFDPRRLATPSGTFSVSA
jgi:hypothetical protein